MVIRKTAYVHDGVCGGRSDVPMGGLITWQCAHGNCDGGGDAGTVDADVAVDVAVA